MAETKFFEDKKFSDKILICERNEKIMNHGEERLKKTRFAQESNKVLKNKGKEKISQEGNKQQDN